MPKRKKGALQYLNPAAVPAPFSRYSQGVEAPADWRWLHISGQVGVGHSGALPESFAEQARTAWRNLLAILDQAGMSARHLVKVTAYVTRPGDVGSYRVVRDSMLGEAQPASILVVVAALADPRWLVEIEAVAAAPDRGGPPEGLASEARGG